jgi:TolB-like protein/lipopolysaccharide biosynthesis regulator YciM
MTSSGTRKLAAIMFTDMVGYTALMQQNERQAKKSRDHHRDVLNSAIQENSGTILQYYGDGTLSIFNSAVDAVTSAVQIQQQLQKKPKVPLRIGIHTGDVVHDEEGIYGDGVNIASRIESMAVPGSVLISGKVFDEIKNHTQFETKSYGPFRLKNVEHPTRIYCIVAEGCLTPNSAELKGKGAPANRSIAVVPFVNMSTDPENEYFSDGITEEILNALVKVDGLQVTSRTSSFAFKGKNLDVREIGKLLNVTTVLEGSVRKAGKKVRITAQLINCVDDYHLWSETYDRQLEDIFEVQDEISRKIANQLRAKLTSDDRKENLVTAPTENLDAYNTYLRGSFFLNSWTPQGAKKAIEYFYKAIEMEKNFSLPYSGLAYSYTMLGAMGQIAPIKAYPIGKEMAEKALALDNELAESHVAMALIKLFYEWDLDGAEQSLDRAKKINPGSANVYHFYALYFVARGKYEEGIKSIKIALELDPLSLIINQHYAEGLIWIGKLDESLVQLDKTLEMDPNFRPAVENKGWVYIEMGEYEKAIKTFQKFQELTGHPLKGMVGLGYAYAISGKIDKARECLDKLAQREKIESEVLLHMDYVVIYTALKDFDKVFYYLEEGLKQKAGVFFLKTAKIFKDLRKDSRFQQLMTAYGYSSL